jgi:hypothetical protein
MKKLITMILFFCASAAEGYVSVKVYESDGNTPFDNRDIMVGTRLTIVLDSNIAAGIDGWYNDLALTDANIALGTLLGRDFNEAAVPTPTYEGSYLEAVGVENSYVIDWEETGIDGISFFADSTSTAGGWFIVDYNATDTGNCLIEFYDNWEYAPDRNISFVQVPTRDFNKDKIVNFGDFAVLASYWLETDCNSPGWCGGADLDTSTNVDSNDLSLFADYWLEKTWYP